MVKKMKPVRFALLIFMASLMLPFIAFSVDLDASNVIGVIVEKSESGSFIQVGDYAVSIIEKVMLREDENSEKEGKLEDLYIGGLVDIALSKRNDDKSWKASSVTILLGSAQEKALAGLSEEERDILRDTQANLPGQEPVVPDPEEKATSPQPAQENLRLENGVWVN